MTIECGPWHYRRCKAGGVGHEEFAGSDKALVRLDRSWLDCRHPFDMMMRE